MSPRGCTKSFTNAATNIINKSVKQAFMEKLAEYIGIDISDIV